MKTNIRSFIELDKPYTTFNREERNLAAIFFHVLNLGDNTDRFLRAAGCRPLEPSWEPAIYYEFALLRDIWWTQIHTEAMKRTTILRFLPTSEHHRLQRCTTEEFNSHFGAVPRPSTKYIQSPSTWSVPRFDGNIGDNQEFLATCMFKWAFNAKPDLVIQTGPDRCVCIEAKLESGEGRYPGGKNDKAVFRRRGLAPVTQTELQRYTMVDLLGFDTDFVLLAQRESRSSTHRFLTWKSAFEAMEVKDLPTYMKQTVRAAVG